MILYFNLNSNKNINIIIIITFLTSAALTFYIITHSSCFQNVLLFLLRTFFYLILLSAIYTYNMALMVIFVGMILSLLVKYVSAWF